MSGMDSESFPRGGKIVKSTGNNKRKREDSLFGVEKQSKVKRSGKEKPVKPDLNTENLWQASLKFQGTLSYNKMQTGMVVLSCVRHISNLALQIEFPGITFGAVTINHISDSFTKKLSDELKTDHDGSGVTALQRMFQVGQFMPAKIVSIKKTEKGHEVQASINPVDINSHKAHNSFVKGATIWASVTSELDHGYELSLGVNNCRVFLPFKNTDKSKKYEIGEPLYCLVHKVESSTFATTLTVSAKLDHKDKVQLKDDLTLDDVIPGMRVEFLIEEVSSHGIKGQFLETCFGYVDETHIFSKVNRKNLREGSTIQASVLFVEPITKVTYLTLRQLQNEPHPQIKLGTITSAKVLLNVSKGLYLQLGKNETGFVTNKRLLNTLPKDAQLNIIEAIGKKYSVGSNHDCRILDYNYMQQLYICTFEKQIIKEKVFNINDLKLGQLVSVTINKILPNGLIVKAGHIQGFVPNIHLSNVKYSENIKGKFSIRMSVNARVLNIAAEDNVIFTLKQGLVESEKCLVKIEDAICKSQYIGFVVQTKISGALIAFYGDVKGWISSKVLNSGNSGRYTDPRDYFFIGQVVTVWILGFKNNKLQVSLNVPTSNDKKKKIKLGDIVNGTITMIKSDGIDVEVGPDNVEATVPVAHLSSNLDWCRVLLKSYQLGQQISNLVCVKNTGVSPIVSKREFMTHEKTSVKVPRLRDLKRNMVLRCSFEENSDLGIYVSTPLQDYHENILILNENIICNAKPLPPLEKQQCILAKIMNVDYDTKKIDLAFNYDHSNKNIENQLSSFLGIVEDLDHLINFKNENHTKLTEYKIGERVSCKIEKVNNDGNCFVTLPNGINGIAPPQLCSSNSVVGTFMEGVVLDYNFLENYVDICGKNNIKQKINKIQDGLIKKSFHSSGIAKILLIKKFYMVGVLNDSQCNRQLVYLPLPFTESEKNYDDKLKVVIYTRVGNRIIGLPKRYLLALEKATEKKRKKKTQKSGSDIKLEKEQNEDEILVNNPETIEDDSEDNIQEVEVDNLDRHVEERSTDDEDPVARVAAESSKTQSRESVLSGTRSFYVLDNSNNIAHQSSSEEEEEDEQENERNKKKKKLSSAERAEIAKKEEERIAKIEKELADSTATPQSVEQFDRLLLANPNSSELWLQYMAMHVSTAELEKARAVGKRAIETINMTLIKEKFNIWIALLNLENMYGTKDSLEKLFEEAVRYNDSLDIYLSVIKMLATSGKLLEMEEKIKKIRSKEKQSTKMWLEVGQVYYSLEKFSAARNIKEAALKSILDKKRQFDLIVKFGIMEFQLGDLEQAIANFETILNTYPNKTNIWIIYVDQLVKRKKIELARKVLERAVAQKFTPRAMKIIFQKFISFEEQYGTHETVDDVKKQAKEYVRNVGR